jgi:predicted kinase
MRNVYIMCGIPGSGKSTYAKRHWPNALVCSADDYHMVNGVYQFDQANARAAHSRCLVKYVEHVNVGADDTPIVVDNTNTSAREIAPYYALAEAYGWEPLVVMKLIPYGDAFRRQIHEVPGPVMDRMFTKLVQLCNEWPPFWKKLEINCTSDDVFEVKS